jgi:HD-GYP domain-containing protein (c-di-GMP phosphodiesterase class II)
MKPSSHRTIEHLLTELIKTLSSVIEEKDPYLRGHADRVTNLGVAFAGYLELSKLETKHIYLAGLLHDVAKIYLPSEVLGKSTALSADEILMVQQHPVIGERILAHLSILKDALPIIRHHHENWDGNGYPDGLRIDEIPFGARILRIVDTFDAMVSDRPHRKGIGQAEALTIMAKEAGKAFDPQLLKAFVIYMGVVAPKIAGTAGEDGAGEGEKETLDQRRPHELITEITQNPKFSRLGTTLLPKVIRQIQRAMELYLSTDEIIAEIEKDATLSLKLISVANSSFFMGVDKVSTLKVAVTRLGLKETRNVVSAVALKNLFASDHPLLNKIMEQLWTHSLACAYGAKAICTRIGYRHTDKAFLKGLLHDFGKVQLLGLLPKFSTRIDSEDIDAVMEQVNAVHCSFGGSIIKRWEMPKEYIRTTTLHQQLHFSDDTEKPLLMISLANLITRITGHSLYGKESVPAELADLEAAWRLGLGADDLEAIITEVGQMMESTSTFF